MNILFSSTLCSKRLLDYLYGIGKIKPEYNIQKFYRMLLTGVVANGGKVSTVTTIPCTPARYDKKVFIEKDETEDGIDYHYAFVPNVKYIKNPVVFLCSFFYSFFWCLRHRKSVVICDVLNVTVCLASLCAAKLTRTKCTAIVTDMPGLLVQKNGAVETKGLPTKFMKSYVNKFDSYILITEQMNELINTKRNPYIVIEGMVDSNMISAQRKQDTEHRIIMYAGGLFKQYGLNMLLDAFVRVSSDFPDAELHLYGNGPSVPYIKEVATQNKQVVFHGSVTNDDVVAAELKSTLLVNPRPTHEAFTKYSFPSKNMEYMVSGTPVLTSRLPGMPTDYYPHVFIFDDESTEGIAKSLREILTMSNDELDKKGTAAKKFVLDNKNNIKQGERVLHFLNNIANSK